MKYIFITSLLFLIFSCEPEEENSKDIITTNSRGEILGEDFPDQFTPRCLENSVFCVIPAYPNPFLDFADLRVVSYEAGIFKLYLYKNDKLVLELFDSKLNIGMNILEIPNFDKNGIPLQKDIYELRYSFEFEDETFTGFGYIQIK